MAKGGVIEPGTVIDDFTVGALIHKGGMAVLYEATHPTITDPIVLKAPLVRDGEDPASVVGFEMEQMILPTLSGPHVPKFFGQGDFITQPYIAMERIQGEHLHKYVEMGKVPINEVIRVGAAVARAVHALHKQHVIHLDLKPTNIMLEPDGTAVLIDFGLSHHQQLPDLLSEEFRLPFGTGPYMAPEQIRRIRTEPKSDLFSLGVILYQFICGETPFGTPDEEGGLKRRLYRDAVPPIAHRPDCPPWLQELVLSCMEIDPARRPPSAAQLAFMLEHPDQVRLTERATRKRRDGFSKVFRRWLNVKHNRFPETATDPRHHVTSAPIIMAAVVLAPEHEELARTVRGFVERILVTQPDARVACVTIQKTSLLSIDETVDEDGTNIHLSRLIELKHWAEPLNLVADRLTFHVLEANDPGKAIIDYARKNHVDHIVMGARASGAVRRYLGSVSAQVVAEAPCTVSVVRLQEPQGEDEG